MIKIGKRTSLLIICYKNDLFKVLSTNYLDRKLSNYALLSVCSFFLHIIHILKNNVYTNLWMP